MKLYDFCTDATLASTAQSSSFCQGCFAFWRPQDSFLDFLTHALETFIMMTHHDLTQSEVVPD